jgi:predicted DNA-binding WGR domain protein
MTTTVAYGWELEHVSAGSDKFYRLVIVPSATTVVINYGRRGTVGQFAKHPYADLQAARDKMARLTREKTGKGYTVNRGLTTLTLPQRVPDIADQLADGNSWKTAAEELMEHMRSTRPDEERKP